jgi:hypothetical protein
MSVASFQFLGGMCGSYCLNWVVESLLSVLHSEADVYLSLNLIYSGQFPLLALVDDFLIHCGLEEAFEVLPPNIASPL